MKHLLLTLSLLLAPVISFGQSEADLNREAGEIIETLKFNNHLMSSDGRILNAVEIKNRFVTAQEFMFRAIGAKGVSDESKARVIVDVADAYGKMFVELTKPFMDVEIESYDWNKNANFFENLWGKTRAGTLNFATGVWRDIRTVAQGRTFPFLGQDAKRTVLINKIGRSLKERFNQSVKQIGTTEGKQGLAAVMTILERAHASEVSRFGSANVTAISTYAALGIWQFFQPFTELPYERTTYSPLFAGLQFLLIGGTFAVTRLNNSGVNFNLMVKKLEKRAKNLQAQFDFSCNAAFGGKSLPKPTLDE